MATIRDRSWRRYKEEIFVIKRLRVITPHSSYYFSDINKNRIQTPKLFDYIGSDICNFFKRDATDKQSTKYKMKYSPNKPIRYWRDGETRESDRLFLLKLLKENGIR